MSSSTILKLLPFGLSAIGVAAGYTYINKDTIFMSTKTNKDGKLIWISGRSGSGKSTTGDILHQKYGFTHYECDSFIFHHDPFSGPMYKTGEKPVLEGISIEQKKICKRITTEGYIPLITGRSNPPDFSIFSDFYNLACNNILEEKEKRGRDGKHWAITNALYTRACRDYVRSKLGEDSLIIVSLELPDELAIDRMATRAGVPESAKHNFKKYLHGYDAIADDEPNTLQIKVNPETTQDDVCQQIIQYLDK